MSTERSSIAFALSAASGLEAAVSNFFSLTLVPKLGAQISATELYERFRSTTDFKQASDVKLAALFSNHMKSKRVASGKVWLDYYIPYELDWSGPAEDDVTSTSIIINISTKQTNVSLRELGRAWRNLKVISNTALHTVSINCDNTLHMLYPDEPGRLWHTTPDLWITAALYSDIILQITAIDEPATPFYVTISCDASYKVPPIYTYTNTVTYRGDTVTFKVMLNGQSMFCPALSGYPPQQKLVAQTLQAPLPAYKELPLRSGYVGFAIEESRNDLSALSILHHTGADYVTDIMPVNDRKFAFIRKSEQGYKPYLRVGFVRKGDLLDQIKVVSSLLPRDLICANIVAKRPNMEPYIIPIDDASEIIFNMLASKDTYIMLELSTTFFIDELPSRNILDILEDIRVTGRYYFLESKLRRAAAATCHLEIYDNIHDCFFNLRCRQDSVPEA